MAYGARKDIGWVQCWNNGKYAVDVYVYYYQDIWNNKTKLVADNQRVRSLDSYHSFYNASVNNGFGWQTHGGGAVDVNDSVNVPKGGTWTRGNSRSCSVERVHDSSGVCPTTNLSCQFIAGINQYDTPEFNWRSTNVAGSISKIDREAPNFTVKLENQGLFNLSFEFSSNEKCSLIEYLIDGGVWKNTGVTVESNGKHSFELTELNPGQAYSIKFKARRDYNHVYSSEQVLNVSTLKPTKPSKGYISVSNIQPFSVHVSWSGFSAGEGTSINRYEYSVDGSVWHSLGNVQEATISGLSEETSYVLRIRAVDNFEQTSEPATFSFQTIADQLKILINVNGVQKVGRVFVNVGGVPKKVKKGFVNHNGMANRIKNYGGA